jgi:NAD(P)-dependent dehydrogenase (short-subunit alcohol dehydrogenase family)
VGDELTGKVALVTGAGNGIGEAIAKAFASEGAAVGVLDNDAESAASTVQVIESAGGRGLALSADVRSGAAVKAAIDTLVATFGGLDIVANCAGIVRIGPLPDFGEDEWDSVLDTNLKGMYQTTRFAIPLMRQRGRGAIVNIASVQAYWSQQGAAAYAASKAGVVALTRVLALDHAREGIHVAAIAPGSVRTPMLMSEARRMSPEDPEGAVERWGNAHPIGRIIEPEEIAYAAVFLASDRASAITGTTLLVDGGLSAGPGNW